MGRALVSSVPLTVNVSDLPTLVGRDLPMSDWLEVTQGQIDRFADLTDDHQWIHVDVQRATRENGGPIAHGFLTLSLLSVLGYQTLRIKGARQSINYGLNRLRFVGTVRAGSRIRLAQRVLAVEARGAGYLFTRDCTVHVEHQERPALVTDFIVFVLN